MVMANFPYARPPPPSWHTSGSWVFVCLASDGFGHVAKPACSSAPLWFKPDPKKCVGVWRFFISGAPRWRPGPGSETVSENDKNESEILQTMTWLIPSSAPSDGLVGQVRARFPRADGHLPKCALRGMGGFMFQTHQSNHDGARSASTLTSPTSHCSFSAPNICTKLRSLPLPYLWSRTAVLNDRTAMALFSATQPTSPPIPEVDRRTGRAGVAQLGVSPRRGRRSVVCVSRSLRGAMKHRTAAIFRVSVASHLSARIPTADPICAMGSVALAPLLTAFPFRSFASRAWRLSCGVTRARFFLIPPFVALFPHPHGPPGQPARSIRGLNCHDGNLPVHFDRTTSPASPPRRSEWKKRPPSDRVIAAEAGWLRPGGSWFAGLFACSS